MTKYEKRDKYGITWIKGSGELWFADSASNAFDCGIWTGVTTAQLNDPKYLAKRSSHNTYWKKYV